MNWDLYLVLTGLMLFSYWLTYVMGNPLASDMKNVDGRAILFGVPYFFAVRRLEMVGMWKEIQDAHIDEMDVTSDPVMRARARVDHLADTINLGRQFFTWERSLFCPICLHFWLTILVGFTFLTFDIMNARADLFPAALVYLVNHFLIRKIS